MRSVATTWTPKPAEGETEETKQDEAEPDVTDLSLGEGEQEKEAPKIEGKGRVFFVYTCPSGSPIKFRMVYSSGVRGIQQDASDKAGIEIAAKVCPFPGFSTCLRDR